MTNPVEGWSFVSDIEPVKKTDGINICMFATIIWNEWINKSEKTVFIDILTQLQAGEKQQADSGWAIQVSR
ncbi:MAG: hypothetical protein H6936_04505 [Burkholderiales bacterium]|nr:hypothetical protein [Nitrosomonas sp.]MCP5274107.1 hypothetical protein [Burkholderiales bacterium]